MKYLLILMMLYTGSVFAQGTCEVIQQDVNTPVPEELKDKEICIRDPKTKKLDCSKSANEYKVVKRKQQFKVTKQIEDCPVTIVEKEVIKEVPVKERKNVIITGLSNDYTDLSNEITNNGASSTVRLYSNKGLIGDIGYMRRKLFDTNFGAGISVNTNIAPRIFLGFEF